MSSSPDAPHQPTLLRGASAARAVSYLQAPPPAEEPARGPSPQERRTTIRRAEDQPVVGRPSFRLGDVYAEELARLREQAHAEGFAAGHAEGMRAAEAVVAETERAARAQLAEVQARWERRLVSAVAALESAARGLEEAALPVAEEVQETILGAAMTLVEDLLGRELTVARDPGLDALRRALRLCPADAPVVVRLHPDDLAEVAPESLAELPDTVTVLADDGVERAGAIAETGPRRIDAQIGAALERVQAVLRP